MSGSFTDDDGVTRPTGEAAAAQQAADAADAAADAAPLDPTLLRQLSGAACLPYYAPCTCSGHCCGDSVCGFPKRGAAAKAAAAAAAGAAQQDGGAVDVGGPSCRPLSRTDLVTGVVDYGCAAGV